MIRSNESYMRYLEALVVSLIAERIDQDADIVSADDDFPPCTDTTFAPMLIRQEITEHRAERRNKAT